MIDNLEHQIEGGSINFVLMFIRTKVLLLKHIVKFKQSYNLFQAIIQKILQFTESIKNELNNSQFTSKIMLQELIQYLQTQDQKVQEFQNFCKLFKFEQQELIFQKLSQGFRDLAKQKINDWAESIINSKNIEKKILLLEFKMDSSCELQGIQYQENIEFMNQYSCIFAALYQWNFQDYSKQIKNVQKIYQMSKENMKILNTFNSICYSFDNFEKQIQPVFFRQLVKTKEYLDFVKFIKQKAYTNNNVSFQTCDEFKEYTQTLEQKLKVVQKSLDNMLEHQTMIQKFLQKLSQIDISQSKQKLLEVQESLFKRTNDEINKYIQQEIYELCINQISKNLHKYKKNQATVDVQFQDNGDITYIQENDQILSQIYKEQDDYLNCFQQIKIGYFVPVVCKIEQFIKNKQQERKTFYYDQLEIILQNLNNQESFWQQQKNLLNIAQDSLDITTDKTKLQNCLNFLKEETVNINQQQNYMEQDYIRINMISLKKNLLEEINSSMQLSVDLLKQKINQNWQDILYFIDIHQQEIFNTNTQKEEKQFIQEFNEINNQMKEIMGKKQEIEDINRFFYMYLENISNEKQIEENIYQNFMKNYDMYYSKLNIEKQNFENELQAQFQVKCHKLQKMNDELDFIEQKIIQNNITEKLCFQLSEIALKIEKFEIKNQEMLQRIQSFPQKFSIYFDLKQKLEDVYRKVDQWIIYINLRKDFTYFEDMKLKDFKNHIEEYKQKIQQYYSKEIFDLNLKKIIEKNLQELQKNIVFVEDLLTNDYDPLQLSKFQELLKLDQNILENRTGDILEMDLGIHRIEIKSLQETAQNEKVIKQCLDQISYFFYSYQLSFQPIKNIENVNNVFFVKDFKEIQYKLEEKIMIMSNIKLQRDSFRYTDLVDKIQSKLQNLEEVIEVLKSCQQKWIYLYPILSTNQMLNEQKEICQNFIILNDQFLEIINNIYKQGTIQVLCESQDISEQLKQCLSSFDKMHKKMHSYLEQKRSIYPRLYMLGDEDLMEILGNFKNKQTLNNIVQKIFSGLKNIVFDPETDFIVGGSSHQNEVLQFVTPFTLQNNDCLNVLIRLEKEIRYSLKKTLENYYINFKHEIDKIPIENEQMASLNNWIKFYEIIIKDKQFKTLKDQISNNLKFLSQTNFQDEKSNYIKRSLIMDYIYQKDILERLVEENGTQNFLFYSLLKYEYIDTGEKYYNNQKDELFVDIAQHVVPYQYEFLGNIQKLVFTPLTEKCYFLIAQAIQIGLGGNPFGPAGTGKTETIKQMAKSLGNQVLVFNCDKNLEVENICRIFKGICGSGAWGCFDEFNRLQIYQLSIISIEIQKIQFSLKYYKNYLNQKPETEIQGEKVPLVLTAGIFITLNPVSKEYKGRSQLPDSLKQLFRCFQMTKPDLKRIFQVMLMSNGFEEQFSEQVAELLSMFSNSTKQMFKNRIYDWGLRTMKDVIILSGNNYQTNTQNQVSNAEYVSVKDALKNKIFAKIQEKDLQIFKQFFAIFKQKLKKISNYQPTNKAQNKQQKIINNQIQQAFRETDLSSNSYQTEKINQLFHMIQQKTGVCLVGKSYSGKSSIFLLFQKVLQIQQKKIETYLIQPNIFSQEELFGYYDKNSMEFIDGVFIIILRKIFKKINENQIQDKSDDLKFFVIFEGVVNPEWIEALNSSLDDNKLFTLASGERFKLPDCLSLIFECLDLDQASPATISRLGIVSVSQSKYDSLQDIVQIKAIKLKSEDQLYERLIQEISQNQQNLLIHKNFHVNYDSCKINCIKQFICNKKTRAKEFIDFLIQSVKITKNKIIPLRTKQLIIIVKEFQRVQPDEYGTRQLEQLLTYMNQQKKIYIDKIEYQLQDIFFCIVAHYDQKRCKLTKKLKNRLLSLHFEMDAQNKIQQKNLDKMLSKDMLQCINSKQRNQMTEGLIEYLNGFCKDQTKIKNLQKINISGKFFKRAFKNCDQIYKPFDKNMVQIFQNSKFFKVRLSKLMCALNEKSIKYIFFNGISKMFGIESFVLSLYYLEKQFYFITNNKKAYSQNLFLKELRKIWEILLQKELYIIIEQDQLQNDVFANCIDNLINYNRFSYYDQDLQKFLQTKDENEYQSKVNKMFQNMKVIVIWNNKQKNEYQKLIRNFSCFEYNFVSIQEEENLNQEHIQDFLKVTNDEWNPKILQFMEKKLQNKEFLNYYYFLVYYNTFKQKIEQVYQQKYDKYLKGVQKLQQAEKEVNQMSENIQTQQKQLMENEQQMNQKIQEITMSEIEVEEQQKKSIQMSQKLNEEREELQKQYQQIQNQLEKVMPLVEKAKEDVQSLNKSNIDELRNYKYPPDTVVDIFTVIMKLLNELDVSWSNMRKFLGKRQVIDQIVGINPENINQNVLKEVESYMNKKKSSFEYQNVLRQSKAAAPIAEFLKAIIKYVKTVQSVKPYQENLNILQKNLKKSEKTKEQVLEKIDQLKARSDMLRQNLKLTSLNITQLKNQIVEQNQKLQITIDLLESLKKEKQNWEKNLKQIENDKSNFKNKIVLISYFCSYLVNYKEEEQKSKLQKLQNILQDVQEDLHFFQIIENFQLQKLQNQQKNLFFKLNLMAIEYQTSPLLIINKAKDFSNFIQNINDFEVLDYLDPKLYFKIQLANKFKKSLLIQNIPKNIDYQLYLLLDQRISLEKNERIIQLGDIRLNYYPQQQIYLETKESNLEHNYFNLQTVLLYKSEQRIQKEIQKKIIQWQNPQLETEIQKMQQENQQIEERKNLLEENLLKVLSDQKQESFIENQELIDTLNTLSQENQKIQKQNLLIQKYTEEVKEKEQKYQLVCERISQTIFLILNLEPLNEIYAISSIYLIEFLDIIIKQFQGQYNDQEFLKYFSVKILAYVLNQLFNQDVQVFLLKFISVMGIFDRPNEDQRNLSNFIKYDKNTTLFEVLFLGYRKVSRNSDDQNFSPPQYFNKNNIQLLQMMKKPFFEVYDAIQKASNLNTLENFSNGFNSLQNLVLNILCFPQKVNSSIYKYIKEKLGSDNINKNLNFIDVFKFWQDNINQPLLIIQNKNTTEFFKPEEIKRIFNMDIISLAIGDQNDKEIFNDIKKLQQQNVIIRIINLHLKHYIADDLLQIIQNGDKKKVIIVSEYIKDYSKSFLESCYKIVLEQRPSVYQSFNENKRILSIKSKSDKILLNYSFVHSLIIERQNYQERGWSKNFDFNDSDIVCAEKVINSLKTNFRINNLRKILKNFIYKSKVDRFEDQMILDAYFDEYFQEQIIPEVQSNDNQELLDSIQPELFGLNKISAIDKEIKSYKQLTNRLQKLSENSKTLEQKTDNLTLVLKHIQQILQNLYINTENRLQENNNLQMENFYNNEVNIYTKVVNQIKNIHSSIKQFFNNKIKKQDIIYFEYLHTNSTPLPLLDMLGTEQKFTKYLDQLLKIKKQLEINLDQINQDIVNVSLQGIISQQRLFEFVKINEWKRTNELQEKVFVVSNQNKMRNNILLRNMYIQGVFANKQNQLMLQNEQDLKHDQILNELPISCLNLTEISNKKIIKVPCYQDQKKEKLIIYIYFQTQENDLSQLYKASPCLYIFKQQINFIFNFIQQLNIHIIKWEEVQLNFLEIDTKLKITKLS